MFGIPFVPPVRCKSRHEHGLGDSTRERRRSRPHETDWRSAVEQLRRRIRKATGHKLLRAVVLTARGPASGYRLAPGVRVRAD